MLRPSRFIPGAAAVVLCLLTGACGLKGPLYLPDQKAQSIESTDGKRIPHLPAPQSQKKNRGTGSAPIGATPAPPSPPDPDRSAAPPPGT